MNDHRYSYILVLALLATLTAFSVLVAQGGIPQIPREYAWVGILLGIFCAAVTTRLPAWSQEEYPPPRPPLIVNTSWGGPSTSGGTATTITIQPPLPPPGGTT
jgi:hypothetical protein